MTTFEISISYGQICVFIAGMSNPFNDWRESHASQGFAWREGSVSFKTLDQAGVTQVFAEVTQWRAPRVDAVRVIVVPFTVPAEQSIEVASIADSRVLNLQPGNYKLVFEHGQDDTGKMWCHFLFERVNTRVLPQVLRADESLKVPSSIVMDAEPA